MLFRLSETRRGAPPDPGEAASLVAALDYFRKAAPQHTTDEEESLFPRLRAAGALASLDSLEADHRVSAAAHEEDALGRAWLDNGALPPESAQRMAGLLRQLAHTCQGHIALEDREIFPAAGRVLSAEQIAAVGREMKNRRNGTRTER